MKRNVVLYVGAFELPDLNAAAQRVRANATLLTALGYEVVLVGRNSDPDCRSNQLRKAQYDGIDHDCWEMGHPAGQKDWLRYISGVAAMGELVEREYSGRLHSIICYNFPAIAQFRVRKVAHRAGARAMADVTEWYQSLVPNSVSAIVKNFDTWFRMRIVNPRMDALITTSRYLTRYYTRWFDDIVELPTLIEHDPTDLEGLSATPDGEVKRLYYGGSVINKRALAKEKGGLKDRIDWVIELLDAVKQAGHDFRFDIYGVARKDYLEVLPDHELLLDRLEDSVCFHGRRPRHELLDAQKRSDFSIFMRSSMRTTLAGFPTKFTESISFGNPVITNALENIAPYMNEGENCERIDYDSFEESVVRISACLALPAAEVFRRKLACRQSAQFHPLSFVEEAAKLFPNQRGV
ncbi:MAG: glycosyltransferase [Donghicola eburneus]|nr:glycosyltransferase [Donghicola eburneus]MCI5039730.1 glycosyltransferase [Donghicola eburneus]